MSSRNVFKKVESLLMIGLLIIAGCSSAPQVIVDQAGVDKGKLKADTDACIEIARSYDLENETAGKAVAGAAIGGAATAGVAAAVAGAVFAPAIPFIVAGSLAGGGLWGAKISKKEADARQAILESCMEKRGYEVYSAK
mgnify:CR=1 FL=1